MAVDNIKMEFSNKFEGKAISPTGEVLIGSDKGMMKPYHLLFSALGSCFYATFISIVEKKKLCFSGAELEISGTQRDDKIKTLDQVDIFMRVFNASDEKQFERSAELGALYCSIHETVNKVAKINVKLEFFYEAV